MGDAVQTADAVISGIGDVAIDMAEASIVAQVPFLGLPVIKQIMDFFIRRIAGEVLLALKKSANIGIIDFQEESKNEAAKKAADDLKKVQSDAKASQEELDKAREEFKKRYADLIRMRVSTPN